MTDQANIEVTTDDEAVHYIGFWARFVAFMLDSIVASLLMVPLATIVVGEIVMSDYDLSDEAQLAELMRRMTTQMSFDVLLMGTIFILFWIYKNATPGNTH